MFIHLFSKAAKWAHCKEERHCMTFQIKFLPSGSRVMAFSLAGQEVRKTAQEYDRAFLPSGATEFCGSTLNDLLLHSNGPVQRFNHYYVF